MTTKGKKKGAPSRKFTRWDHTCVDYIHEQIVTNQYPTLGSIARHFRVSRDTIKRNVRHMRDDLLRPIRMSRKKGKVGFFYSKPVSPKAGRTFNELELTQMMVAHNAVSMFPVKKHQK